MHNELQFPSTLSVAKRAHMTYGSALNLYNQMQNSVNNTRKVLKNTAELEIQCQNGCVWIFYATHIHAYSEAIDYNGAVGITCGSSRRS